MGSIEHTGTMRAVQGAANGLLGSAVSSIKDTFSQLALGRIHITHKKRRYKSKGAALFDKPGPSKAPVAAECPDGDVYCAKLMDMRKEAAKHVNSLDGISANGIDVFMPMEIGQTQSPVNPSDYDSKYFCGGTKKKKILAC